MKRVGWRRIYWKGFVAKDLMEWEIGARFMVASE